MDPFLLGPRRMVPSMEDANLRRVTRASHQEWGVFASESADGQFLYFSKYEVVWKVPLKGGEETRVLDKPAGDDWWNWALTQDGIYFFDPPKRESKPAIKFLAFATGKITVIAVEDTPVPSLGLTVSPDSRSILFTRLVPGESRIMLMKNFR